MDLSSLRQRLALTQRGLADLLGVHSMTVSRWERGLLQPRRPARDLLEQLQAGVERGELPRPAGDPRADLADWLSAAESPAPPRREGVRNLSATNHLPGAILSIQRGDVLSKLIIEVAPGVRVGSVITTDSVNRLGLAVGGRAVAVIKATEVMVGIE